MKGQVPMNAEELVGWCVEANADYQRTKLLNSVLISLDTIRHKAESLQRNASYEMDNRPLPPVTRIWVALAVGAALTLLSLATRSGWTSMADHQQAIAKLSAGGAASSLYVATQRAQTYGPYFVSLVLVLGALVFAGLVNLGTSVLEGSMLLAVMGFFAFLALVFIFRVLAYLIFRRWILALATPDQKREVEYVYSAGGSSESASGFSSRSSSSHSSSSGSSSSNSGSWSGGGSSGGGGASSDW
jgi:uncharacterized membrane protein YgcG